MADISPPQATIEGAQNATRAFGESMYRWRGHLLRQLGCCIGEVVLGGITGTNRTHLPRKKASACFDFEILAGQVQAGIHTIGMEVTDASGMRDQRRLENLTVYDTPLPPP